MKTWSRRVISFAAFFTALLLFRVGPTCAATLVLPIASQSVLSEEGGTTGILVDFGALDSLTGKKILYAKCYLSISIDSCTAVLDALDAKPLAREWSAVASGAVSLTDSTEEIFTDAYSMDTGVGRGRDEGTEILLTELLQAWVDGRMANHGLVLLPRSVGCSYRLLAKSEYPGNGYGKLLVKFVDKRQ